MPVIKNGLSRRQWRWYTTDLKCHLSVGILTLLKTGQIHIQSTLSKADTLETKATVRFREVSGLESVRLERVDCSLSLMPTVRID